MTAIAAFTLTSTATQAAAPFVIGHTFAQGAVPAGQYAHIDALANFSVVPVNAWNDGSLKFAMLAGRAALSANTPLQLNIVSRSVAPTVGTVLTAATIATAAPTAFIQFGANGTATLSNLGTPKRTWYSTKEVVCCEYTSQAGSDAHLWAQFFVWVFADGRRMVRAVANNGYFMGGAAQRNYVPTVVVDGVTVFSNAGATYYHAPGASWDVVKWTADPQVTPRHDTGKMQASKMVPNYERTSSASNIGTYLATVSGYTPGARLGYSQEMGSTGFQDDIGLLAQWEGQYFVKRGTKDAYDAVIDNGRAIRSYAIAYPDPTTQTAIRLADYPNYSLVGAGSGGSTTVNAKAQDGSANYLWEIAHHPSSGYLPYLLTADPYFLQTCQYTAKLCYLMQSSGTGSSVNRTITGQVRGRAWSYRSIAQAAAICPDSMTALYGDTKTWFANLMSASNTQYAGVSTAFHGIVDQYDNYLPAGQAADGSNCAGVSMWQHDFLIGAIGAALGMEPCASMTGTQTFFNYVAKSILWRLGPGNDSTSYCFTYAGQYFFAIPKTTTLGDGTAITAAQANPANAGEIFTHTNGAVSTPDNTLHGTSGSDPTAPSGYWGQVLTGIAAAVENGISGALACYNRLTGAANYATTIAAADYALVPNFGLVSRTVSQQSNTFTAIDTGAPVPTPGPSSVMHTISILGAGKRVMGKHHGHGVPLTVVPTGGVDGTSPLRDMIQVGDNPNSEIRWAVTRQPAGTLLLDGLGGFTYSGRQDYFTYDAFVDGALVGSARIDLVDPSTVASVVITPSSGTIASGGTRAHTVVVSGTGSPSQSVTWTTNLGSINPSTGLLTAPTATGVTQIGTVTATSTQDNTKTGTASFTVAAAASTVSGVTVSPSAPTVAGGTTQQFAAAVAGTFNPSQAVNWTSSAGNVTVGGLFTAPAATGSAQTITIAATSVQDGTKAGTATVTVPSAASTVSGVAVSPATAAMIGGQVVDFGAVVAGTFGPSQSVTWTSTLGSINPLTGVLTAPGATLSIQNGTVTATSVQDGTKVGTATFTVAASVAPTVTDVVVSPQGGTISAPRQYSAVVNGLNSPSQAVTWTCSAGSIDSSGLFTPPAAANDLQAVTITATSDLDNSVSGTATVLIAAIPTSSAGLAVSISDAAATLRLDSDVLAAVTPQLASMIRAITQEAEHEVGRVFITRQVKQSFGSFPRHGEEIQLDIAPAISVESIEYRNGQGAWQTVDPQSYELEEDSVPALIALVADTGWPSAQVRKKAVRVNFTAGYGPTSATVPECAQQYILLRLAEIWDPASREFKMTAASEFAPRLLDSLKVYA